MSHRLSLRRWRAACAAGLTTVAPRRAAPDLPAHRLSFLHPATDSVWTFVYADAVDRLSGQPGSPQQSGDTTIGSCFTVVYDGQGNRVLDRHPTEDGEQLPHESALAAIPDDRPPAFRDADPNLARFVARPWDEQPTLQHNRARLYAPTRGIWMTDDGPREVTDDDFR